MDKLFDDVRLKSLLAGQKLTWRKHALERMLKRGIARSDVVEVLEINDQIEAYPTDFPFPSALFFGKVGNRVLHVVAALDVDRAMLYVISAYDPDEHHFENDMKIRRSKK